MNAIELGNYIYKLDGEINWSSFPYDLQEKELRSIVKSVIRNIRVCFNLADNEKELKQFIFNILKYGLDLRQSKSSFYRNVILNSVSFQEYQDLINKIVILL